MGLRDIGSALPPGFRFYPSDEELVCHYLYKKIANEDVLKGTLVEIDLHTCEPWQLPEVAKLNSSEWYFFSFRDRKYATGYRTNRATTTGYWKATGKDRTVVDPRTRTTVGMRKTLVFYKNRAPNGIKTGWIMHEFRLENPHIPPKEDWVLCRVFYKAKGDQNNNNNNEFSPENTTENYTAGASSPTLTTSPQAIDQTMSSGYHQHHDQFAPSFSQQNPPCSQQNHQNPSNFFQLNHHFAQLSRGELNHHFAQLSRGGGGGGDLNEASINEMMVNSKSDDHYGFLFDLGFDQENSFGDNMVVPPNHLEDMAFDDDDNGLVFQL